VGIAGALNVAARRAIDQGFSWLLTMDQDSKFLGDGFAQLVQALDLLPPKTAVLGPDYLDQGRSAARPRPVGLLIQSGTLVHLPSWQAIGPFDESLFIDGVDHDYCLRARLGGYGVYEWPQSRLSHALGDLHPLPSWFFALHRHKKSGISFHKPYREYYEFRNNLWLLRRYGLAFSGWAMLRLGYLLLRLFYALSILPERRERACRNIVGVRLSLLSQLRYYYGIVCIRQDIIGPQNRPTKLVFWYFCTFVCCNACFGAFLQNHEIL
jgi:rhamnosyltransferase